MRRSWLAPHRIKLDNTFYGRNSAGNYPLDVGELRIAFTQSGTVAERVQKFRTDRLICISAGQTPIRLATHSVMVIHMIPVAMLADGRNIDIVSSIARGTVMPLPPGRSARQNDYAYNLDGVVNFADDRSTPTHAYAQVFRSGAIEGVQTLPVDDIKKEPHIFSERFEDSVVSAVVNYLTFLQSIDVAPPIVVSLAICGARGYELRYPERLGLRSFYRSTTLSEDTLVLPNVMIEDMRPDIPAAMKLAFNTMWNAFGLPRSNHYDADGKWINS